MFRVAEDMIDLVGYTPMVKINHIVPNKKVKVYAKLERYNPAGSVKDRIAKYMIEYGEREGLLTKDKIVIEPTSGNTGIALAMVCAVKGYRLELVMPETMSMERRKILTAFGAKIILSKGSKGMDGAIDLAEEMAKDPKYYMPHQFENKYNVLAHYETTGEEIWRATKGKVRMFVGGLGTTGTLMGVSKRLKEYNPDIKIVGVEPYPNSNIQGLKNLSSQYVPEIYDPSRLDEKINVTDEDAFEMAKGSHHPRRNLLWNQFWGSHVGNITKGNGVGSWGDCHPLSGWWREVCEHASLRTQQMLRMSEEKSDPHLHDRGIYFRPGVSGQKWKLKNRFDR